MMPICERREKAAIFNDQLFSALLILLDKNSKHFLPWQCGELLHQLGHSTLLTWMISTVHRPSQQYLRGSWERSSVQDLQSCRILVCMISRA